MERAHEKDLIACDALWQIWLIEEIDPDAELILSFNLSTFWHLYIYTL